MHDHYPTNIWPAVADFVHKSCKSFEQVFFVGLIFESTNLGSAVAVVSGRATEKHHCTAVGPDSPLIGRGDGGFGVGDRQPRLSVRTTPLDLHGRQGI